MKINVSEIKINKMLNDISDFSRCVDVFTTHNHDLIDLAYTFVRMDDLELPQSCSRRRFSNWLIRAYAQVNWQLPVYPSSLIRWDRPQDSPQLHGVLVHHPSNVPSLSSSSSESTLANSPTCMSPLDSLLDLEEVHPKSHESRLRIRPFHTMEAPRPKLEEEDDSQRHSVISFYSDTKSPRKSCLKPSKLEIGPEWFRLLKSLGDDPDQHTKSIVLSALLRPSRIHPLVVSKSDEAPIKPLKPENGMYPLMRFPRPATKYEGNATAVLGDGHCLSTEHDICFQRPGILKRCRTSSVSFHWAVQQNLIVDDPNQWDDALRHVNTKVPPRVINVSDTRLAHPLERIRKESIDSSDSCLVIEPGHEARLSIPMSHGLLKIDPDTVFFPSTEDVDTSVLTHMLDATVSPLDPNRFNVVVIEAPSVPVSPEETYLGEQYLDHAFTYFGEIWQTMVLEDIRIVGDINRDLKHWTRTATDAELDRLENKCIRRLARAALPIGSTTTIDSDDEDVTPKQSPISRRGSLSSISRRGSLSSTSTTTKKLLHHNFLETRGATSLSRLFLEDSAEYVYSTTTVRHRLVPLAREYDEPFEAKIVNRIAETHARINDAADNFVEKLEDIAILAKGIWRSFGF